MDVTIGVGIIGASAERGWAKDAHIPAIAACPDFELRAVATSRQESAAAAGAAFGVPAYTDPHELAADPRVDLIVVSVKVPLHKALVGAAIQSGKAVLCEWPLGANLTETAELEQRAREAGVPAFIGLQARSSPAFNHVRALIRDGYVGEVLSTTLIGTGGLWGPHIEAANAYILDRESGASMLMIPFGHTIDGVCFCLGEAEQLTATTATRRHAATVMETGQAVPITVADQIATSGILQGGAVLSAHYRGGVTAGTGFLWEINGTEGDLQVSAANGLAQMVDLTVKGSRGGALLAELATPPEYIWAPPGTAAGVPFNVAQAYVQVARDLREGTRHAPTFEDALVRHRMLHALEEAARTGTKQHYL